jgi:hypothetical protein
MSAHWIDVRGVLETGYGVASGRHSSRYPDGTIRAQLPHFRARGVDLTSCFPGTLNVSIAPHRLVMRRPRHTLAAPEWWPGVTETFSFSPCRLLRPGGTVDGFIYYPHPETKPEHHQPPTTVEIVAPFIGDLEPGGALDLQFDADEVSLD